MCSEAATLGIRRPEFPFQLYGLGMVFTCSGPSELTCTGRGSLGRMGGPCPRGCFLGWGLWGFPAEKEPGNVVPRCEDAQASGALPLLLHPCFFPVMSLGLGTSCHFLELAPCLLPIPVHLHPETHAGLGPPGLRFPDVPCFLSPPKTPSPRPGQRGPTLSKDHSFASSSPELEGSFP